MHLVLIINDDIVSLWLYGHISQRSGAAKTQKKYAGERRYPRQLRKRPRLRTAGNAI